MINFHKIPPFSEIGGIFFQNKFAFLKYFHILLPASVNHGPINYGAVAQLVRASACHAEGREFESRQFRHFIICTHGVLAQLV